MSRATAVLISLALASLTLTAQAHDSNTHSQSQPSQIPATDWMPITDELGFVIEQSASTQNSEAIPSVVGYFVVRHHDGWLRLDSIPQMALLDWPLRSSQREKRVLIAPSLAFVIEEPKSERGGGRTPAAVGYFVAERSGHWVRLDPIAHGSLFAGPLTASPPTVSSVPVTSKLRFVLERLAPRAGHERTPSALGYFVLEQDGHALRLNPIAHGALFRQPLKAVG